MSTNYTTQHFMKRFDEVKQEIPFNPSWNNGTGYLNFAVIDKPIDGDASITEPTAVVLASGEMAKSVCPRGRKMIFVGTRLGTVIVFQRYGNGGNQDIYVLNADHKLKRSRLLPSGGQLSEDDVISVIGDIEGDNIGLRLNWIYQTICYSEMQKASTGVISDN